MKNLFVILLITMAPAAFAGNESGFEISVAYGEVTITGYTGGDGSVVIPATLAGCLPVTTIGNNAFSNCTGIISLSVPASVSEIGYLAFRGCTGIKGIHVDTTNSSYSSRDGVLLNKQGDALITYPAGKKGKYAIPESVTAIGGWAFYGCIGLTSISVPASVTVIMDGAFYGCTALTHVTISGSVIFVDDEAFYGCTKLTTIRIGANVNLFTASDITGGFGAYYISNGKKAGVYTFRNGAWTLS